MVIGSFSATDLASRHIRELILSDQLPPGTKVKIEDLAVELGISRTPVRDALTRLQTEGLVEIRSRVGVYVREITIDEVLEVYTVKESLEPVMARWATERSTPEERQAFYDSVAPLRELANKGESEVYTQLVVARRLRMLELSRSEVLASVFGLIDERVRMLRARHLRNPERLLSSHEEHYAIAAAVKSGDAELASDLTRSHVQSARLSLMSMLESMRSDESARQEI